MRLTEYSHGAGWACKLSQKELAQVLTHFIQQNNSDTSQILVATTGSEDDGGLPVPGVNFILVIFALFGLAYSKREV